MMQEPAAEVIASAIENTLGTTPGVGDAARRALDELHNAGYFVITDSFAGLVRAAQAMLAFHYPESIFQGESVDAGAQFVFKLREALRCVHADHVPDAWMRNETS